MAGIVEFQAAFAKPEAVLRRAGEWDEYLCGKVPLRVAGQQGARVPIGIPMARAAGIRLNQAEAPAGRKDRGT